MINRSLSTHIVGLKSSGVVRRSRINLPPLPAVVQPWASRWRRRRCALPCPDNISTIVGAPPRETPSRRRRARVASAASRRYVRVKRKNTTVFLNVEKSDSFGGIKAKLAEILGADAEKIHLYTSRDESTETVDTAFVDNFCESDVVVYMKLDGDKGIEVDEPPKPSA